MSRSEAPVPVSRLGFLGLAGADDGALASHYIDILGLVESVRTGDSVYLTTGPEHHCLVLEQGEGPGCTRIGLEIAVPVGEAEDALEGREIKTERRSDPDPGIAESLVVSHLGLAPLHLYERQTAAGVRSSLGTRPTKLNHVASWTPSAEGDCAFLEEVLGFRSSDSVGEVVQFLRCDPNHHSLNVFPATDRTGLHHLAFEARDHSHLVTICDHLGAEDVPLDWGIGRHGPGHNQFTYHHDPLGNMVEISTEMDVVFDESEPVFEPRPWHEDVPQRPKAWQLGPKLANIWGPLSPELQEELARRAAEAGEES